MTPPQLTAADIQRHDEYYRRGCKLVDRRILLHGRRAGLLGWLGKRRLRTAAGHFQIALEINPENSSAMWNLGKIYQRLGQHEAAFSWFKQAHEINPGQPDVAREAGLEALELKDFTGAASLFETAIQSNPSDPGLLANLALAQLLSGDVGAASESAQEAMARNPGDSISVTVVKIVEKVRSGKRTPPKSMRELQRLA